MSAHAQQHSTRETRDEQQMLALPFQGMAQRTATRAHAAAHPVAPEAHTCNARPQLLVRTAKTGLCASAHSVLYQLFVK